MQLGREPCNSFAHSQVVDADYTLCILENDGHNL